MKKFLAIALTVIMLFSICSLTACGKKPTINVMSFTAEVPNMVQMYMDEHPDVAAKYDVNVTVIATTDGLYQPALDEALASKKDSPDIYAAEAAFVLKYTQGDASQYAATYEELGFDVAAKTAEADIAQFAIDIGTRPADGKLVGLPYQSTGGAFIYRRSIAKDVWGTDDPEFVAKKIGAGTGKWDAFFAAAEELKEKGYAIVSGDGDIWHAVENSTPAWVVDGKLNVSKERAEFLDLSKKLKDNGYHHDTQDWQEGWFADMKKDGGVLGFYGPAWLINYTLGDNCGKDTDNSSFGDWAVCAPNIGFCWGGTWVLAGKGCIGTDKQAVVADIINWITLDCTENGLMYRWANGTFDAAAGTKDTVASGTVMAMSDGKIDFCGGQNVFEQFVPANQYATGKNMTQYDEVINTAWREAVRAYTAGTMTRDEAIASFKTAVGDKLDIIVE